MSIYKDVAKIPVSYFEAKPQRAVGFDEVVAIIVPDNISVELKKRIMDSGIPIVEYSQEDNDDRLEKLNNLEDVRFSKKATDRDAYSIDTYSKETYNKYGWVYVNNIFTKQDGYSFMNMKSKLRDEIARYGKSKIYQDSYGDYALIVNDKIVMYDYDKDSISEVYIFEHPNSGIVAEMEVLFYESVEIKDKDTSREIVASFYRDGDISKYNVGDFQTYEEMFRGRSGKYGKKTSSNNRKPYKRQKNVITVGEPNTPKSEGILIGYNGENLKKYTLDGRHPVVVLEDGKKHIIYNMENGFLSVKGGQLFKTLKEAIEDSNAYIEEKYPSNPYRKEYKGTFRFSHKSEPNIPKGYTERAQGVILKCSQRTGKTSRNKC